MSDQMLAILLSVFICAGHFIIQKSTWTCCQV